MTAADFPDAVSGSPAPLERRALRDGVYDAVLELLLEGRVQPGASLGIDSLARDLGVSQTPVREALAQLEHTGLVTRAALKGYRVAPPLTADGIAELVDARSLVELAAVRGAVPVDKEVLRELRRAHAQHQAAAQRISELRESGPASPGWSQMRQYYVADWNFHLVLLTNCGNRYLLQMAEMLSPHVHRLRQSVSRGVTDVDQAVTEHAEVLSAITSGNPAAAEDAMRRHLHAVRTRSIAES